MKKQLPVSLSPVFGDCRHHCSPFTCLWFTNAGDSEPGCRYHADPIIQLIGLRGDPRLEQEACFILMLWAISLMGYKALQASRERQVLQMDLFELARERVSCQKIPGNTRDQFKSPEDQQGYLLPRALLTALHRFRSTRNIQDVSNSVRAICDSESERLDSNSQ